MESPQAHGEVVVEGGWGGPFSNHRGWSYEATTVFRPVLEELPHILFCEHQDNIFYGIYRILHLNLGGPTRTKGSVGL